MKRYIIDIHDEFAIIRDMHSKQEVGNDTIKDIVTSLNNTVDLSEDKFKSRFIGADLADKVLSSSPIIYGDDLLPYMDNVKSKGCVYFITHIAFPGLIKIGKTRNLKSRMAQIAQDNYRFPPTVLAIIRTKQYGMLERYLHMTFQSCRIMGEWFDADIVSDSLERVKAGDTFSSLTHEYKW